MKLSVFLLPALMTGTSAAQIPVVLPENPYRVPTIEIAKMSYQIAWFLALKDTSITLRLGQYFEFLERRDTAQFRHRVRFDSVEYNGGGNNRKAWVSMRAVDYPPPGDSVRLYALSYEIPIDHQLYSGWQEFGVTTPYKGFQTRVALQKIINVGLLSIAKLRVVRHDAVPVDSIRAIAPMWPYTPGEMHDESLEDERMSKGRKRAHQRPHPVKPKTLEDK